MQCSHARRFITVKERDKDSRSTFIATGNHEHRWATYYLADALRGLDRAEDAIVLLERILTTHGDALESRLRGDVLTSDGQCLLSLNRLAEAEEQLHASHKLFAETLGAKKQRTRLVVRALIDLYEKWGKPEGAAEWRAKLPKTVEAEPAKP